MKRPWREIRGRMSPEQRQFVEQGKQAALSEIRGHENARIPSELFKVFVDTNILMSGVREYEIYRNIPYRLRWGPHKIEGVQSRASIVGFLQYISPRHRFLRKEVPILQQINDSAHRGELALYTFITVTAERLDSPSTGHAGNRRVHSSYLDERLLRRLPPYPQLSFHIGSSQPLQTRSQPISDQVFSQLENFRDPRFLEFRRYIVPADAGKNLPNHLFDCFHLWLAEHNVMDFLLTMDRGLISRAKNAQPKLALNVRVVTPSELLIYSS